MAFPPKQKDPEGTTKQLVVNFKAQVLTYAGIIGGALTLLSNSDGFLRLAHFAKTVASKWEEWTSLAWNNLFGFFELPIYRDVYLDFTLATMLVLAGIGGQILWRKRNKETGNWLNLSYVVGWHFPIGATILLLHGLSFPFLIIPFEWLYERYPDQVHIYMLAFNWPFSIPALLCFGYKWPIKERLIGTLYIIVLVSILDLGLFFGNDVSELVNETPFHSLVVAVVYSLSALAVMMTVKPAVFVNRLHNIIIAFMLIVLVSYVQDPVIKLMRTLFGE
jgi:hypothetical protein